jgi:hypothetical protein
MKTHRWNELKTKKPGKTGGPEEDKNVLISDAFYKLAAELEYRALGTYPFPGMYPFLPGDSSVPFLLSTPPTNNPAFAVAYSLLAVELKDKARALRIESWRSPSAAKKRSRK